MNPTQRVALGLDDPAEFGHGTQLVGPNGGAITQTPPVMTPNLKLALLEGEKASAPRIRTMVQELLAGNMTNADFALKQLFASNPKLALETYIELTKFALPQLKAVAVQVDDRSDNPRAMSFADLQKALMQD